MLMTRPALSQIFFLSNHIGLFIYLFNKKQDHQYLVQTSCLRKKCHISLSLFKCHCSHEVHKHLKNHVTLFCSLQLKFQFRLHKP